MKTLVAATFVMVLLRGAFPQEEITPNAEHFGYDATTPLGVKEVSVKQRDSVSIQDITYISPNGGEVPAYLVVPKGPGKFAAILWGHWLMPNSPTSNREEFLNEAIALDRNLIASRSFSQNKRAWLDCLHPVDCREPRAVGIGSWRRPQAHEALS